MDEEKSIVIQVRNCARCGGEHVITFVPFNNPCYIKDTDVVFTHWGICPTNYEPILLLVKETFSDD